LIRIPGMSTTKQEKEEIRQLFRKHVPEVAEGTVEIVDVSRHVKRRSCVVVCSSAPTISPVAACAGERGARLKAMCSELGGEHITVVLQSRSAIDLIATAFSTIKENVSLK